MNKFRGFAIALACVGLGACNVQNQPKEQPTGIDHPDIGAYVLKDAFVDYTRFGDDFRKKVLTSTPDGAVTTDQSMNVLYQYDYHFDTPTNTYIRQYPSLRLPTAALDLVTGKFVSPWPLNVVLERNGSYMTNTDGSLTYFDANWSTHTRFVIEEAQDLQSTRVNQVVAELGVEAPRQQVSHIANIPFTLQFSEGAKRFRVTRTALEDRYLITEPLMSVSGNPFLSLDELMVLVPSYSPYGIAWWKQWWNSSEFRCYSMLESVATDRRSGTMIYFEDRLLVALNAPALGASSSGGGMIGVGTWLRITEHGKDMIVFNDIPEPCKPAEMKNIQPFIALNDLDGKVSMGLKIPKDGVYSSPKLGSVWSYNLKAAADIDRLLSIKSGTPLWVSQ